MRRVGHLLAEIVHPEVAAQSGEQVEQKDELVCVIEPPRLDSLPHVAVIARHAHAREGADVDAAAGVVGVRCDGGSDHLDGIA